MAAYSHTLRKILVDNHLAAPHHSMMHVDDERIVYRALCPYGPGFSADATAQLETLAGTCVAWFPTRARRSRIEYWNCIHAAVPFCARMEPSLVREFTLCLVNCIRRGRGQPGSPLVEALGRLSELLAAEAEEEHGAVEFDEADSLADEMVTAAITREVEKELRIMRQEALAMKAKRALRVAASSVCRVNMALPLRLMVHSTSELRSARYVNEASHLFFFPSTKLTGFQSSYGTSASNVEPHTPQTKGISHSP